MERAGELPEGKAGWKERRKRQEQRKALVESKCAPADSRGAENEGGDKLSPNLRRDMHAPDGVHRCSTVQQGECQELSSGLAHAVPPNNSEVTGSFVTEADWKSSIALCSSFASLGCVLAWWMIACHLGRISPATSFLKRWLESPVARTRLSRRPKGSTFPIRTGEMGEFLEAFSHMRWPEVVATEIVERWHEMAWLLLCSGNVKKLAGAATFPTFGKWTSSERDACKSMLAAIQQRDHAFTFHQPPTETEWQKEMGAKHIGHNGEEVSTCHVLTWDQILPALPPQEYGGCIDALDWVSPRTKSFLLNPERLLLPTKEVVLPRVPGKVHMAPEDKMKICSDLFFEKSAIGFRCFRVILLGESRSATDYLE